MSPARVLSGNYFMNGDHACAEGAIAAGCRFFGGYPITPSTEIAERLARRMPEVNGVFLQMEDELGSMAAILGASAAGTRSMTATSGPGLSLMLENLGLGVMLELPCVLVDVQRGSPSTGLPTMPAQSDVMQVRWGSHGDYQVPAYAPWSPQEMFELTILAFNVADRFRVPVCMLADEVVGHMVERVVIPPQCDLEIWPRKKPQVSPDGSFHPFEVEDNDLVPPIAHAGDGYRIHYTGLTHDEHGYPDMSADTHHELVTRLVKKVKVNAPKIIRTENYFLDDARVIVIAYGCTARSARSAVRQARDLGIKAGLFRLISLWPFPEEQILSINSQVESFIVAEMNLGQISLEVERITRAPVGGVHHAGGAMITPEKILAAIMEKSK
jgi:2-oxoglutarate ferredoxin oxidoreductase subunit alpha